MVEMRAGYCTALAPADWSFTSIEPYQGADLFSPDKRIHAAWGITGIYKALYPTDESALNYLMASGVPGLYTDEFKGGGGLWILEP